MTEKPVSNRSIRRNHFDTYLPKNVELSAIVETLAADFATEFNTNILSPQHEGAPDVGELVEKNSNAYKFPYGSTSVLPPALFGIITDQKVSRTRSLVVPNNAYELEEMIASYMTWADNVAASGKTYASIPTHGALLEALKLVRGREMPISQWEESARSTQATLTQEPIFTIDIHRVARLNAGASHHDDLPPEIQPYYRQTAEYIVAPTQRMPTDERAVSLRELSLMPIGDYGIKAAEKLGKSVTLLGDLIRLSPAVKQSITQLTHDDEVKALLRKHTMRTREAFEDGVIHDVENGLSDALIGGILSMAQVISFLTAEKIEGYDDFETLVADILDSTVLEDFARYAPVGYIGPVTLGGTYVPGALDTTGPKPVLSQQMKSYLIRMHKEYTMQQAREWHAYDAASTQQDMPRTLGLTCPASEPDGAISALRPILKSLLTC